MFSRIIAVCLPSSLQHLPRIHLPFFIPILIKFCFSNPNVSFLLSRPFLPFLTIPLKRSLPSGACSGDRSNPGAFFASAVGGEWLGNHCHKAVLCCPQHGQETERLRQSNYRDKITGCKEERGGESHRSRRVTQNGVAAVATASFSKAGGSMGSRLHMTQLALLTRVQVWMKPRLTPEVCSEFILLMHIQLWDVWTLYPVAVLAGVKIATEPMLRVESRAWESLPRLTVKQGFRGRN